LDGVVILYGTETGNAEDLAEELAAALSGAGFEAEVVDMDGADPGPLDGTRGVIVCTATHGDGELPIYSQDFYETLDEERPDLGGVVYGVCGLGDSAYPDFCAAGRTWSRFLAELGAEEVVERYEIDGDPDEDDIEGACEWALGAAERFAALAGERR
jgi:MioC protein